MGSSTAVALDWLQFRYFPSGWWVRLHSLKLHRKNIRGGEHSTTYHAFIDLNEGYTKYRLVHIHTQTHTHTQVCICAHTHTLSVIRLKLLW